MIDLQKRQGPPRNPRSKFDSQLVQSTVQTKKKRKSVSIFVHQSSSLKTKSY